MFDIGFTQILLIGIVALVVLGPERLPRVARTIGHLVGRAQRYVGDVKSDIQREMELDHLKDLKGQMEDAAKSVQTSVKQATDTLKDPLEEARKALKETTDSVESVVKSTQDDLNALSKSAQDELDELSKTTTDGISGPSQSPENSVENQASPNQNTAVTDSESSKQPLSDTELADLRLAQAAAADGTAKTQQPKPSQDSQKPGTPL